MVVASSPRVSWSDAELRHAISDFTERRQWSMNRLAAELAWPENGIQLWFDGEPASMRLRTRLLRMVDAFTIDVGAVSLNGKDSDAIPDPPIETAQDEPAWQKEWEPIPTTATAEITEDPDTGEFQVGDVILSPDNPLPFGFAILMPVHTGFSGYPAALVIRDKSVAITTALRAALGEATHVVIGVDSRTDRPDGYAAIAIAPVASDHPWFSHAHRLTKSGEWGAGFRANLGLPSDVYIAERQGEQDLWICRPREWATEKAAA